MSLSRREMLKHSVGGCLALSLTDIFRATVARAAGSGERIADRLSVLPPRAVQLQGYLERYIQLSLRNWSKKAVPYRELAGFFRTGRPITERRGRKAELFAAGEMWGKAVRSAALFYRYTGDPEIKAILQATVADLLSMRRENGTISCSAIDKQPDGPNGDIWERTYVLLGLEEYYRSVERDPAVLKAMMDQVDATMRQVGPPPKTRIVDLGWSANKVESSAMLEPVVRLYTYTSEPRYLDFARYIVEEGGAQRTNLFAQVLGGADPAELGGVYPKAYEMTNVFEGLLEYYRVTGQEQWRKACVMYYEKVRDQEITLVGSGGADQPYRVNMGGEGWDYTAREQTNPNIKRMMETDVGVQWVRFCQQILRLTADPIAVDYMELYAYNGLIGAMRPQGDGFSYSSFLNGIKTEPKGWGTTINGVYVTCCNLNAPMGLGYLPLIAVMSDSEGPVVNLYNACTATVPIGAGEARLTVKSNYPKDGVVRIEATPGAVRDFTIKLRIPAWSEHTTLNVNGKSVDVRPGTYARIERRWSRGDVVNLALDMRCRLLRAKEGSTPGSDRFQALVRGPVVLARDENIDPAFDQPVDILATEGFVDAAPVKPTRADANMQFTIPTRGGPIPVVDYASVNSWEGKKIQTWLPMVDAAGDASA